MAPDETTSSRSGGLRPYILIFSLFWTAVVCASLAWNLLDTRWTTLEQARMRAREAFSKDVIYRSWNAGTGGVYVPIGPKTPANPYLKVKRRDITDDSGVKLTMVNPAYMTRMVHEIQGTKTDVRGHITSLKPIRPGNAPDKWESAALRHIAKGYGGSGFTSPVSELNPIAAEVSSVEIMNARPFMRLMRPLITMEKCLKCHEQQGHVIGDIRGGISVSIPLAVSYTAMHNRMIVLSVVHVVVWLIGLMLIGALLRRFAATLSPENQ